VKDKEFIVPVEKIGRSILFIRGEKVMLDVDLAVLYGVTTKRLNEQVKRNRDRFPEDFMFQLAEKEKAEVVANCDHLKMLKFSPHLPYAFTEHGAIMLATVLSSPVAVQASIQVVMWLKQTAAWQPLLKRRNLAARAFRECFPKKTILKLKYRRASGGVSQRPAWFQPCNLKDKLSICKVR